MNQCLLTTNEKKIFYLDGLIDADGLGLMTKDVFIEDTFQASTEAGSSPYNFT